MISNIKIVPIHTCICTYIYKHAYTTNKHEKIFSKRKEKVPRYQGQKSNSRLHLDLNGF